jgi:arabinogalactan oligomer / maltooligosaccharide transport system substrate-binding protein
MKKGILTIASLGLSVLLLAGCGPNQEYKNSNGNANSDKPRKLLVWEDLDSGRGIEEAVERFEKEHDVEIEIVEKAFASQLEALRLDGPSGSGPDIITIPDNQVSLAAKEGLLAELDLSSELISSYTEVSMESQMYNGKYYGIPKATDTNILFFNKDLISEEDLPKTVSEWYDYSKLIVDKNQDNYGLIALWDQFYYAHSLTHGYGAYIFGEKDDGQWNYDDIGLNNNGAIEAGKIIEKFYQNGVFPQGVIGENGITTLDSLFTEGKAAAVISGAWNFRPYEEAGVNYGVTLLPKLDNGKQMGSFLTTKCYNVSSYSKNPELAQEFLEYIAEFDQAKERYGETQEIPPLKELLDDPIITENEKANAIAEQSKVAFNYPHVPEMNEVWLPMDSAYQLIATGKEKPKGALDGAVKTIKAQIEANY